MKRVTVSLVFLAAACSEPSRAATASPTEAAHHADVPAAGASAVSPALARTASSAKDVQVLKLRLDGQGRLVKQALYHGDRAAIPDAVLALAEQTHPGATAVRYESEIYADLGEIFEVELETADGRRCEVASRPDGSLVYQECRIDPSELPAVVAQASTQDFPGAEILEAERKTGADGSETYSVELKHDGREYYLVMNADGTVTQRLLRVPALVEIPI